jgi:hypothetical protein
VNYFVCLFLVAKALRVALLVLTSVSAVFHGF